MKTYKISVSKAKKGNATIIVTDTPQRAIEMGFVFILAQLGHEHLILNIDNGQVDAHNPLTNETATIREINLP
jgi:hypothetical protein